ncbi:MAG: TRAP transporter substrate-binding protein DctP [Alphaproteobacteria bacterium]|jgi:TRAP-type C4-dicarboxylate transport system substrate-binding protein|nr:TRAP transporter substrate-binding protein DctP [Alphaproteobacteria bacterium]
MKFRWTTIVLAASLYAGSALAQGAAPIKLKLADSLPTEHFAIRFLVQPWIDEVAKRSNGAVSVERFPAQQLGKAADLMALSQTGVIDIGYVGPSYVTGNKMPHSEVAQLPAAFETACQGTMAYWKLGRGDGLIAQGDFAPNKLRLLLALVLSPYVILTPDKPLATLKDFEGRKLRSTGSAMDLTARALGAVPTRIAAPDIYEALSRRTVDGAFYAVESVLAYGMEDIVKYSTDKVSYGSFVMTWVMRNELWQKLPPETRKAMDEVADTQVAAACKLLEQHYVDTRKTLTGKGMAFVAVDDKARQEIEGRMQGVNAAWAKELDDRGKKGSAVLKAFTDAVAQVPK